MNKKSIVIPFEQTGDFFHKRGVVRADRQEYMEAIGFLRKAVSMESHNHEYHLDLADVLARMGCFEESNRVLAIMIRERQALPECFFGMGCNFFAMQQFDCARDSFMTYSTMEPDGEFFEAVEDMLDEMDASDEEDRPVAYQLAQQGKKLLDNGEHEAAVVALEKALEEMPGLIFARNNLSLAYFCAGRPDLAMHQAQAVLYEDENNLHGNCNMALFLSEMGKGEQAAPYLKQVLSMRLDDPDDLFKLCLALCEMGLDGEARAQLKRLLRMQPFDKRALHYYAVASYNMGEAKQALEVWERVLKIDPESVVALYGYNRAKESLRTGEQERMDYYYQLPLAEMQRRVDRFSKRISGQAEDGAAAFEEDEDCQELVRWALGSGNDAFRSMAFKLLTFVKGEAAEAILRDVLMNPEIDEEPKHEAMAALKVIGAQEPYVALMGGMVVDVSVGMFDGDVPMTLAQQKVLHLAMGSLPSEGLPLPREEMLRGIFSKWTQVVKGWAGKGRHIRKPENWAAALLSLYMKEVDMVFRADDLCKHMQIDRATLRRYEGKLREELHEN